MRPQYHAAVSTVVSAGLYTATGSLPAAAIQWVGGVLIDVDHLFDYFARKKGEKSIKEFFQIQMNEAFEVLFLFFHGFELAVVFGFLLGAFSNPLFGFSLFLGMFQHLVFDQVFNPTTRFSYFLSYRIRHRFNSRICFPSAPKT